MYLHLAAYCSLADNISLSKLSLLLKQLDKDSKALI